MASLQAFILSWILFLAAWLINADPNLHRAYHELHFRALQANAAVNISRLAPYYRNVTAGAAWVVPSSAYDLGARDMSCECFNPDESCCMPKSKSLAPFCIPKNSTCCSNTFCTADETCCGGACCAPETTCSFDHVSSGCCPKGKICSGPAICFDHTSPNCTNEFFQPPQCCPPSIPYCRDFAPMGNGCFASSALPSVATIVGVPSGIIQGPRAKSSTSSQSTEYTTTTTTTTIKTFISTITLNFGENHSVLLTTSLTPTGSASTSNVPSSNPPSDEPIPSSSPNKETVTSISTTHITLPTTSTTSALCFDPTRQSAATCPTSPPSPTFNSIPGESIYFSQASASLPPLSHSHPHYISSILALLALTTSAIFICLSHHNHSGNDDEAHLDAQRRGAGPAVDKDSIHLVAGSGRLFYENDKPGPRAQRTEDAEHNSGAVAVLDKDSIHLVAGSGRVLRGGLGREISVVEGSAKVWKEAVAVDKAQIRVLEGSGRVIGEGE